MELCSALGLCELKSVVDVLGTFSCIYTGLNAVIRTLSHFCHGILLALRRFDYVALTAPGIRALLRMCPEFMSLHLNDQQV